MPSTSPRAAATPAALRDQGALLVERVGHRGAPSPNPPSRGSGFAGDAAGPVGGQEHESPGVVFAGECDVEWGARGHVARPVGRVVEADVVEPQSWRDRVGRC